MSERNGGAGERVLVVSIDGLAPRAITRDRMPNLCALARSGASCYTARTVRPPVTVPAHASMLHGIDPAAHGLLDNTHRRPGGGSRSFLATAKSAGRSTASVLCWLPLDALVEPGAVDHRVTVDSGYEPLDDDRSVATTVELLGSQRPEVALTYLVACDLAGHTHGWDSPEYVVAAMRTDELLGELVAAADAMAVVVTTDHGGLGRNHAEPVPETITTFVVARSSRIAPVSVWGTASILDIAPTVADLAGVPADAAWTGRSLIGTHRPLVDHLLDLLATLAEHSYGERIDMLAHALQTAACARRDGATDHLVLAALLHDVGHVLGDAGEWGLPDHAEVGARALQAWLPEALVAPVRLHVAAKRYLVATDPAYTDVLSPASIATLAQQGGAMDAAEAAAFAAGAHAGDAIALRRWDDAGKVTGLDVRPLTDFREPLEAALTGRPLSDLG
jgi:[1-hydroxy-2-(trimethylamino)ethyl]phosphonate dioxygenase